MTTRYTTLESPMGTLLLAGKKSASAPGGVALVSLSMRGQKGDASVRADWVRDDAAFAHVAGQLGAYFDGSLTEFELEFVASGSPFQRDVWEVLERIPYGTTLTYGQVADRIGAPRSASRSVGTAIGANPLLVVRPCHRVIGANGSLTGYAGGLERKQALLAIEGAVLGG
ncbi:methylated-DNA--[protein]-cysteine S-methyltransferase [Streptomyces sp. NPDC001020]